MAKNSSKLKVLDWDSLPSASVEMSPYSNGKLEDLVSVLGDEDFIICDDIRGKILKLKKFLEEEFIEEDTKLANQ